MSREYDQQTSRKVHFQYVSRMAKLPESGYERLPERGMKLRDGVRVIPVLILAINCDDLSREACWDGEGNFVDVCVVPARNEIFEAKRPGIILDRDGDRFFIQTDQASYAERGTGGFMGAVSGIYVPNHPPLHQYVSVIIEFPIALEQVEAFIGALEGLFPIANRAALLQELSEIFRAIASGQPIADTPLPPAVSVGAGTTGRFTVTSGESRKQVMVVPHADGEPAALPVDESATPFQQEGVSEAMVQETRTKWQEFVRSDDYDACLTNTAFGDFVSRVGGDLPGIAGYFCRLGRDPWFDHVSDYLGTQHYRRIQVFTEVIEGILLTPSVALSQMPQSQYLKFLRLFVAPDASRIKRNLDGILGTLSLDNAETLDNADKLCDAIVCHTERDASKKITQRYGATVREIVALFFNRLSFQYFKSTGLEKAMSILKKAKDLFVEEGEFVDTEAELYEKQADKLLAEGGHRADCLKLCRQSLACYERAAGMVCCYESKQAENISRLTGICGRQPGHEQELPRAQAGPALSEQGVFSPRGKVPPRAVEIGGFEGPTPNCRRCSIQ